MRISDWSSDVCSSDLIQPLPESSSAFIEKASGIKSRYVTDKAGILDPERMVPRIHERSNEEWSILCEMSVKAAEEALARAGKTAADIEIGKASCRARVCKYV